MSIAVVINHQRVLVNMEQLLRLRDLVHAAVFFHAKGLEGEAGGGAGEGGCWPQHFLDMIFSCFGGVLL